MLVVVDAHWRGSVITFRYILYTLPRRVCEDQSLERDLDLGMIFLDSFEDLCRLSEGKNDQEVLRLVASVAHNRGCE